MSLSSSPLLFHMLICGQQPCVCGVHCSLSVTTCLLVSFWTGSLNLQSEKKKMSDCMTLMICFMGDCFLSVVIELYLIMIFHKALLPWLDFLFIRLFGGIVFVIWEPFC